MDSLTIFNNESKIAKCKTFKILEDSQSVTQLKHPNFKNEKYYGGQLHIKAVITDLFLF